MATQDEIRAKDVLPQLIETFPKVQFIVTSHSPFFALGMAECNNEKANLFDLDNGGIKCSPIENDLFQEVYRSTVSENEQFYHRYSHKRQSCGHD